MLISDVMMPHLSGIELAIEVKRYRPACRIVLFSGQAETADLLEDARAAGHCFTLLAKPVHPSDLLGHIRKQWPAQQQGLPFFVGEDAGNTQRPRP